MGNCWSASPQRCYPWRSDTSCFEARHPGAGEAMPCAPDRRERGQQTMLRATTIVRKPAVKADRVTDTVTLDHEGRNRRRIALKGDSGLDFLMDLDKATVLNDGDALKL